MSFDQLKAIAADVGCELVGMKVDIHDLSSDIYPAIVTWGIDHFAVLTKTSGGRLVIHDPPEFPYQISERDFFSKSSALALVPAGSLSAPPRSLPFLRKKNFQTDRSNNNFYFDICSENFFGSVTVKSASCGCIGVKMDRIEIEHNENERLKFSLRGDLQGKSVNEKIVVEIDPAPFTFYSLEVLNSVESSSVAYAPKNVNYGLQLAGGVSTLIVRINDAKFEGGVSKGSQNPEMDIVLRKISRNSNVTQLNYDIIWKGPGIVSFKLPLFLDARANVEVGSIQISALITSE